MFIVKRQTLPVGEEKEKDDCDPLCGVYGHVEMFEACSFLRSLYPRIASDPQNKVLLLHQLIQHPLFKALPGLCLHCKQPGPLD